MLVYDIEIIAAIPPRGGERLPDIEYCAGWNDHASMGVACIGAYDYDTSRYRVFTEGNFPEFEKLAATSRPVIGFNSIKFDDAVCNACGITVKTDYDLLVEMWAAAGLGPKFAPSTHKNFGLDRTASTNLGHRKTGHGALAPVDWQRGHYGKVIDYCLEDVRLTRLLINRVITNGGLRDPRSEDSIDVRYNDLKIRDPRNVRRG